MVIHELRLDVSKPIDTQPSKGHNRWHPDIVPALRVAPGDEVWLHSLDAAHTQVNPEPTAAAWHPHYQILMTHCPSERCDGCLAYRSWAQARGVATTRTETEAPSRASGRTGRAVLVTAPLD